MKKINKRVKKEVVKISIKIRKEIADLGLIVDYKGHVFRPPYKSKDGRIWRLKELVPFSHKGIINAIQYKNKIYNLSTLLDAAIDVNYTKRYEILKSGVPQDIEHLIVCEVDAADTIANENYK